MLQVRNITIVAMMIAILNSLCAKTALEQIKQINHIAESVERRRRQIARVIFTESISISPPIGGRGVFNYSKGFFNAIGNGK